jgi:hypothetical protein
MFVQELEQTLGFGGLWHSELGELEHACKIHGT